MTQRYFAYGSNMLGARLRARCPSARIVTTAHAVGFMLVFGKRGRDGSGKATLVQADAASRVPGVVFEIGRRDLAVLDEVEGPGYRRTNRLEVICTRTSEVIAASTYFAREPIPNLKPFDWYLALVLAGIAEHELGTAHAQRLMAAGYDPDPRLDSGHRREALNALARSGVSDYRSLLPAEPVVADFGQ